MSTEIAIDRRDFLFPFANKGKKQVHPAKIDHRVSSSQSGHGGGGLTKREFIIGGGIVGLGIVIGLTRPWEQLSPSETLESLVTEAKKMEDEFKGKDLSDSEARNQYTKLTADIFIKYYSLDKLSISKPQLLSSIVWVNSKDAFEKIFIEQNQDPNFSQEYLKQVANQTPAFTTHDHKTYINTAYSIYQENLTSQDPKFPKGWNPLKSLRLVSLHEFSHTICQPTEDTAIFSIVDSKNTMTDKKIEGFRIQGFTDKKEYGALYDSIDEACVELLSKYINTDLFHSFISEYNSIQGDNVTAIMTRLEQLIGSAKIDKTELARLHKTSNLRGFLLLLAERGGINSQKVSETDRIAFGFSIFEALIQNNQAILQDYMNSAKRLAK